MGNSTGNTTTLQEPVFLWVQEPNVRGTFGILTFCLSTLIICAWSALHFDIPKRRHRRRDHLAFGVIWTMVAVLCPEGLLAAAIYQRVDASILEGYASFYLLSESQAEAGWLTRVLKRFLGYTGGKEKHFNHNSIHSPSRNRKFPFGLVHAFYAAMGGFAFDIPTSSEAGMSPTSSSTRRDVLNLQGFLYIMKNFPDIIPDISKESITDRVEYSPLGKALLIVQVGWFCASSLSRFIQHLPLSLLEVSTASHGFCTLLTYFVWWSKPQNIAEATPIKGRRAKEVHALLTCSEEEYSKALCVVRRTVAGDFSMSRNNHKQGRISLVANALRHLPPTPETPRPKTPFFSAFLSSSPGSLRCYLLEPNMYEVIPMVIAPLLYGLPHFLGWNQLFPTPLERQIWRISTCVVTGSGFFFISILLTLDIFVNTGLSNVIGFILTSIVYMVASGFLLGESLRQLLFLDPAAYQLAPWSNYWPHFS